MYAGLGAGVPFEHFCATKTPDHATTAADFICELDIYKMHVAIESNTDRLTALELQHKTFTTTHPPPFNIHTKMWDISVEPGAQNRGCEITNSCYSPHQITVQKGEAITWLNNDSKAHTVTSGTPSSGPDRHFDSNLFMPTHVFTERMDHVGTYPYYCLMHNWMQGIVIVE